MTEKFPWIGSFSNHKVAKVWDASLGKFIACGLRKDEFVPTTIIIKQTPEHEATTDQGATSSQETPPMLYDDESSIQKMFAHAEACLDDGDLAKAELLVKAAERKVRAAVNDDEAVDDDWSAAGDDNDDGDDGEDDNDISDDADEEDDDDEDDDEVSKAYEFPFGHTEPGAGRSGMYGASGPSVYPSLAEQTIHPPKLLQRAENLRLAHGLSRTQALQAARRAYPQDHANFQRWNDQNNATAKAAAFNPLGERTTTTHPAHPYATASWAATAAPKRSPEWDDCVDAIQARDHCSRTTALQTARRERPDLYQRYQQWFSGTSAQNQQATRSATDSAFKSRAPSFESLVADEIRKGCNEVVAKQRVLQLYGNGAPPSYLVTKGTSAVARLQALVEKVAYEEGCSLTEAQQIVRDERPDLVKLLR
jgi:hypothetical protein